MRRIILYSFLFLLSLSIAQAACTADTYQNIDCGSFPTYKYLTSNCKVTNTACWIKTYNASARSDNILPMSACSNTCDTANGYIKVGCQVGNSNTCYSFQDGEYYYTIKPICKKRGSYEKCGNGIDDDCDSQTDEECSGWIGIQSCAADTEWHMEWTQTQSTGQFSSMYEINQYVLKCGATLIENYQNYWGGSYVMPSSQTVPSLGTYLGVYPYSINAQYPQSWDVPFDQSKCKKFKVNFRANYDSAGYDALHPGDWPIGEYYLARNLINNPTRHNFTLAEYNNPDGRVCITACGNKLYLEINTINDYISSIYDIVGDYSSHTGGSLWDLYCLRCDDTKWLSNGQGDVPLINGITPGRCCEGTATFNNPGAGNSCCYNGAVYVTGTKNPLKDKCTDGIWAGCIDHDGDGYGNPGSNGCNNGSATDCDDTNNKIYPGAPEICDGKDNQCLGNVGYGQIDEGLTAPLNSNQIGVCLGSTQTCAGTAGWINNYTKISTYNPIIDSCRDNLDNNCNGQVNENCPTNVCYVRQNSCNTGENAIMHLSSNENAHAETLSLSNYNNLVCCPTIDTAISGTEVVRLSSQTNAHAEYGPVKIYNISVYTDAGYCKVSTTCTPQEVCVISLSPGTTNLHAAECNYYDNKVCCSTCKDPGASCTANVTVNGQLYSCPGTKDNACNCIDNFNDFCPNPEPNCLNQNCTQGNGCPGKMDSLCNCVDIDDNCPNIPDNVTCGNVNIEKNYGEECDGSDLNGKSCIDFGLVGYLRCINCRFSGCSSQCVHPTLSNPPLLNKCDNLCGLNNGYVTSDGVTTGNTCFSDIRCTIPCGERINASINTANIVAQKKIALYNGKPVIVNIYAWN